MTSLESLPELIGEQDGKASATERSGGDWQPFATAPRDGTNILVWQEGYDWPEVVRYELYHDAEIEEEEGEQMSDEEAHRIYDAHIAAGGQPTDSMARV